MNAERVLVVGGEAGMEHHLANLLQRWGYTPVLVPSLEEAIAAVAPTRFLFTVVDGEMARVDGAELFRRLRNGGGNPGPIVLLADPDTIAQDQETPALGADATLQKPIDPAALENTIRDLLSRRGRSGGELDANRDSARLEEEIALWRSPKMQGVWEIIQQAARVDVPVLIGGETGTGKGLVARAIHHLSPRQEGAFVTVNCGGAPRELVERELFGEEQGDSTRVEQLRTGAFEAANHGTIFLNHVGDLPPAPQAKLLRFLQDGEFSRVGRESTVKVDVRILASTNQDLERAVGTGQFREDLYFRLNVIQIVVPPLRERREEIPLLVDYFIERYSREFRRERFTLSPATMEGLVQHRYPGNVRELENFVKRLIVLGNPGIANALRFPLEVEETGPGSPEPPGPSRGSLKDIARAAARAAEREAIAKALEQTGWNRVRAARLLRISYRALLYKIKEAGLKQGSRASTHPSDPGAGRPDLHPSPAA